MSSALDIQLQNSFGINLNTLGFLWSDTWNRVQPVNEFFYEWCEMDPI